MNELSQSSTEITRQCKECFNYTPSIENVKNCCNKIGCNYELASTISSSNPNLSCGASFQTYLNQSTQNFYEANNNVNTVVVSTFNNQNSNSISAQLQSQLLNYGANRYTPYQRLPPPVIPPSVLQLQRETATIGIPKPINVCRPKPPSLSYNFMG